MCRGADRGGNAFVWPRLSKRPAPAKTFAGAWLFKLLWSPKRSSTSPQPCAWLAMMDCATSDRPADSPVVDKPESLHVGMELPQQDTLSVLLSASIAHAQLPPILDAEQVAAIERFTKGHVEILAEGGWLPATKFGSGWALVTTQVVQCVLEEFAANVTKARELDPSSQLTPDPADEPQPPAESRTSSRRAKPLVLDLPIVRRPRSRPRRELPDCVTRP